MHMHYSNHCPPHCSSRNIARQQQIHCLEIRLDRLTKRWHWFGNRDPLKYKRNNFLSIWSNFNADFLFVIILFVTEISVYDIIFLSYKQFVAKSFSAFNLCRKTKLNSSCNRFPRAVAIRFDCMYSFQYFLIPLISNTVDIINTKKKDLITTSYLSWNIPKNTV